MKIYKKIFCLIVISIGLNGTALAAGAIPPAKPYFDGFFAGLGGGVVFLIPKIDNSSSIIISNGINFNGQGSHELKPGEYGGNANIFAGYEKTLKSNYILGGELFGNANFTSDVTGNYLFNADKDGSHYPVKFQAEVKNRFFFGGDIFGGYLVSPKTMIYVLFGLDVGQWKVKTELSDGGDQNIVPTITDNFNKWRLGLMPGLGMAAAITDHLALRVQYTYTFYQSFSHTDYESGTTGNPTRPRIYNSAVKTKITPDRGLFTVMLSYLF